MKISEFRAWKSKAALGLAVAGVWAVVVMPTSSDAASAQGVGITGLHGSSYVVVAFNELGMHCMNEDFSELCILPPFNTVRAQVIRRGEEPKIMKSGFTVTYQIPGNTISTTKTNFWRYAPQLFGVNLPDNIGLTGNGLAGTMRQVSGSRYWEASGVPVTPLMDDGTLNAYPLATFRVRGSSFQGITKAVVPVSWEISCNLCHTAEGGNSVAHDILADHDRLHGTSLANQKPVLCASCHADPALGTPGVPGVPTMSGAMHTAHASRMTGSGLKNDCYACHPGVQTDCQRDNHKAAGITCTNCHGGMADVGSSTRTPWADQPKCSNCHNVAGHEYEEPGKLFKDSRGHGGVMCATCHGSPHVIAPSTNPVDNLQAIRLQGRAGTLNKCTVCHTRQPEDDFFHSISEP